MKVAVSIPDPIFEAADRLARQRRVPRSQIFSEALADYLDSRESQAVTDRLNQVYETVGSSVDEAAWQAQSELLEDESW